MSSDAAMNEIVSKDGSHNSSSLSDRGGNKLAQGYKKVAKSKQMGTQACEHCKKIPCLWEKHMDVILEYGAHLEAGKAEYYDPKSGNSALRKEIYSRFVFEEHGILQKGHRVEIPSCVLNRIREKWPAEPGCTYMGFRSAPQIG